MKHSILLASSVLFFLGLNLPPAFGGGLARGFFNLFKNHHSTEDQELCEDPDPGWMPDFVKNTQTFKNEQLNQLLKNTLFLHDDKIKEQSMNLDTSSLSELEKNITNSSLTNQNCTIKFRLDKKLFQSTSQNPQERSCKVIQSDGETYLDFNANKDQEGFFLKWNKEQKEFQIASYKQKTNENAKKFQTEVEVLNRLQTGNKAGLPHVHYFKNETKQEFIVRKALPNTSSKIAQGQDAKQVLSDIAQGLETLHFQHVTQGNIRLDTISIDEQGQLKKATFVDYSQSTLHPKQDDRTFKKWTDYSLNWIDGKPSLEKAQKDDVYDQASMTAELLKKRDPAKDLRDDIMKYNEYTDRIRRNHKNWKKRGKTLKSDHAKKEHQKREPKAETQEDLIAQYNQQITDARSGKNLLQALILQGMHPIPKKRPSATEWKSQLQQISEEQF